MMVRVIDPTHYEAEGLLLHNSGRDEYLWHPDNTLGHLLLLSYSVLTVNMQGQHPCSAKGTETTSQTLKK